MTYFRFKFRVLVLTCLLSERAEGTPRTPCVITSCQNKWQELNACRQLFITSRQKQTALKLRCDIFYELCTQYQKMNSQSTQSQPFEYVFPRNSLRFREKKAFYLILEMDEWDFNSVAYWCTSGLHHEGILHSTDANVCQT